ncbi:MAG: flippase [Candidatus Kerfeldbacteria bacterium]
MSLRTSIIKNTAWLFTAQIVSITLLSIGGLMLARVWGNAVYGIYGFAISFVALFGFLIEFGLPTLLINQLSQRREEIQRFIKNYTAFKVVLAIVAFFLITLVICLTDKSAEVKVTVVLIACNTIIGSFMSFYYAVFRSFEKMKYEATLTMIFNALALVLIIAVLVGHLGLRIYVIASVALTVLNLFVLLRVLGRTHALFGTKLDLPFIRQTFRQAVPLALSTVFISIYFSLDTVMLSFWKDNATVGWYTADYRVIFLLMTFINLFFATTFPVISRLLDRENQMIRVILAMSLRIVVTLVLPATIALSLLAPQFVNLIFGASFGPGAKALSILIWAAFLSGISMVYSNTVLASGRKKIYAYGTAIGALLNIVLNILLIPRWSLNGSAVATVASEIIVLIYFMIYCNKRVIGVPVESRLAKPLILSTILIPLFIISRSLPVHFLITGTGIGVLYFALLFAIKAVTPRDITDVIASLRSKESTTT